MKTVNIDQRGLKAFYRAAARQHRGLQDSAKIMGGAFIETMDRFAPTDTNRYLNGWLLAGQAAGISQIPTRPLRQTRYHEQMVDRLDMQLLRIRREIKRIQERLELIYGRRGLDPRRSDFGRRNLARLRLLQKREVVAQRELDTIMAGGSYIVIFGKAGRRSEKTGRIIGERLTTLRTTIAGGTGEVIRVAGRVVVELRNREPHARLVEKRVRAVARTMAVARQLGVKRAGRAYVQALREQLPRGAMSGRAA